MSPLLITGLDLETTGLDANKGHLIIEVSAQVYRLDTRAKLLNFTARCSNEGVAIEKGASKVHGILAADLVGKPKFSEISPKLLRILERSTAVVTHNGEWFDLPFLAHVLSKTGDSLPGHLLSYDTMQNGMFASYDTKPPQLRELCWAMGVEYDPAKAHAADYDVDVMMACFFKGVDQGYFDISTILDKEAAA